MSACAPDDWSGTPTCCAPRPTIVQDVWTVSALEDGRKDVALTRLTVWEDDLAIARLAFEPESGEIIHLWAHQDHRRRGHARALWEAARPLGALHSPWRTEDGDAFARAVGGYLPPRRFA